MRRTELPLTTKLSAEDETPAIANVLLGTVNFVLISKLMRVPLTQELFRLIFRLEAYKIQPLLDFQI